MEIYNPTDENFEMIQPKNDIYRGIIFPSLSKRIQALFIDSLIIFIIFLGFSYLFDFLKDENEYLRIFIFIFMLFLYEPILIYFFKGTIGQQILNLKVTNYDNPNKKLRLLNSFLRFLIKWSLGWLSFISIMFNTKNRAIHDIVSNSIVTFFEDLKKTNKY